MKIFKYKILSEYNLIIRYFEGKISISDIYNSVNDSADNSVYNSSFSAIYDFRNAEFIHDYNEIRSIADKVRNNDKIFNKRQLALLTNSPNQVVFASLMHYFSKTGWIIMKTFSTLEASLDFLCIDLEYFETIYEELNKLSRRENDFNINK